MVVVVKEWHFRKDKSDVLILRMWLSAQEQKDTPVSDDISCDGDENHVLIPALASQEEAGEFIAAANMNQTVAALEKAVDNQNTDTD